MATTAMHAPTTRSTHQPARRNMMLHMLPNILISGVLPFVAYQILKDHGVATVPAVCAGAIFPAGATLINWLRTRHIDFIAVISLFFLVLGVAMGAISGDARFTLMKDSFVTGLTGLMFVGSFFTTRPLTFFFNRQFAAGNDPAAIAGYNARWQEPRFRRAMYVANAVWAIVMLAEAATRIALVFILPIPVFLIVSQVIVYTVLISTINWSIWYMRQATKTPARVS